MKITRKQTVGENLLYVMVWAAIILVPVLNSQMMSELHISFENVLIAWRQIAPYFIIFIIVLQQVDGNVIGPKILGNTPSSPRGSCCAASTRPTCSATWRSS